MKSNDMRGTCLVLIFVIGILLPQWCGVQVLDDHKSLFRVPVGECSDKELGMFKSQKVVLKLILIKELREEGVAQKLRVVKLMNVEEDEVEVAMRKRVEFMKDSEEGCWAIFNGRERIKKK
jgi:hypothetical protein